MAYPDLSIPDDTNPDLGTWLGTGVRALANAGANAYANTQGAFEDAMREAPGVVRDTALGVGGTMANFERGVTGQHPLPHPTIPAVGVITAPTPAPLPKPAAPSPSQQSVPRKQVDGTMGDPNTSRTWSPMPDLSLPTSLPPGGGVMAPRPYDPAPLEQQLEGATDPSILPSLPPGIESGNRDPHLYSMSWGKNVDIDPETGRPSTSTLVRDPISHTLIQAHEATGGGTVSNPGGQGEDAYLNYLTNMGGPGLAQYKQQKQDALDITRMRTGEGAAEPTAGEQLAAESALKSQMAPLQQIDDEYRTALNTYHARLLDLQTHSLHGDWSKDLIKQRTDQMERDKTEADETRAAKLAAIHKGSAGLAFTNLER
jgi:hypothetical protein